MWRPQRLAPWFLFGLVSMVCGISAIAAEQVAVGGPAVSGDLQVRVVVVAGDLSLRPVPKQRFEIIGEGDGGEAQAVTTDFAGEIVVTLPAGKYRIRTVSPVEFGARRLTWDVAFEIRPHGRTTVELSNDNAKLESAGTSARPAIGDEGAIYERFSSGVFKILADSGHGSGFLVSDAGLVLTNHHVVTEARYLAVKCDARRKVPATLLVEDAQRDLAILRVHPEAVKGLPVLPLAEDVGDTAPVAIGDRVLAIGSPLTTETILTSGLVSKVEAESIYSDVNINEGNSGGPLLDLRGMVVGVTTFGIGGALGPGVSGIVRIRAATPLLERARAALADAEPPPYRLLPVEADYRLSPDRVRDQALTGNRKLDDYHVEAGKLDVHIFTPVLIASQVIRVEREAARGREKRRKKQAGDDEQPYVPGKDFYDWQKDLENFRPVVRIRAFPEVKMKLGSAFATALVGTATSYRFKTDFDRLELLRDGHVVEPIHPGRIRQVVHVEGAARMKDIGFFGFYEYPPEALRPGASVTLRIWEVGEAQPWEGNLAPALLQRIGEDYAEYLAWLDGGRQP